MRLMKLSAGTVSLFVLTRIAVAVPQQQTTGKASIEGTVTRADNGLAIVGSQITINRLNVAVAGAGGGVAGGVAGGGGAIISTIGGIAGLSVAPPALGTTNTATAAVINQIPPAQIAPVTTDSDGKFVIKDLEPGSYRMGAVATGFVRQEFGQRTAIATSAAIVPFALTAGQAMKSAAFHLIATGTISGRIMDDTGQPAIGVPVVVLQYIYDNNGLKTLRQNGTGNANDRGEYRIYGLTPGRYYIGMGNGPGPLGGPRGASGQPSNISYAFYYFPGVSDVSQATIIDVKSGGEAFADMKAVRQQTRAVRGSVVDSTGQMVSVAGLNPNQSPFNISLAYTTFNGGGSFSSGRNYDAATGKFELLNVIPGTYTVQAQMQNASQGFPPNSAAAIQDRQAAQAAQPIAEAAIIVGNSDVENVLLTFVTPVSVPGRLSVEGQALTDMPGYDRVRLQFRRSANGVPSTIGNPPQAQGVSADGTFQVAGMRAGEYITNVVGVPTAYYVKSFQLDDKDVLGGPLEFSGSAGSGFKIVLSPKSGQLSGVVTDAKMQPVAGVQAVVIPVGKHNRADLYKNSTTDKDGRYSIAGLTPGDYKVFAWDGLEPNRYFDPDFMKTYEGKGQAVQIAESGKVAADIQVILIPQE